MNNELSAMDYRKSDAHKIISYGNFEIYEDLPRDMLLIIHKSNLIFLISTAFTVLRNAKDDAHESVKNNRIAEAIVAPKVDHLRELDNKYKRTENIPIHIKGIEVHKKRGLLIVSVVRDNPITFLMSADRDLMAGFYTDDKDRPTSAFVDLKTKPNQRPLVIYSKNE